MFAQEDGLEAHIEKLVAIGGFDKPGSGAAFNLQGAQVKVIKYILRDEWKEARVIRRYTFQYGSKNRTANREKNYIGKVCYKGIYNPYDL